MLSEKNYAKRKNESQKLAYCLAMRVGALEFVERQHITHESMSKNGRDHTTFCDVM